MPSASLRNARGRPSPARRTPWRDSPHMTSSASTSAPAARADGAGQQLRRPGGAGARRAPLRFDDEHAQRRAVLVQEGVKLGGPRLRRSKRRRRRVRQRPRLHRHLPRRALLDRRVAERVGRRAVVRRLGDGDEAARALAARRLQLQTELAGGGDGRRALDLQRDAPVVAVRRQVRLKRFHKRRQLRPPPTCAAQRGDAPPSSARRAPTPRGPGGTPPAQDVADNLEHAPGAIISRSPSSAAQVSRMPSLRRMVGGRLPSAPCSTRSATRERWRPKRRICAFTPSRVFFVGVNARSCRPEESTTIAR